MKGINRGKREKEGEGGSGPRPGGEGPFVGRSVGKGPKGVTASRMDQLESREREREKERGNKGKRKVAAVSRFDCAMFSDSSRERERERERVD